MGKHNDNTQTTFLAGMIIGGILALCGVRIAMDQQEKEELEAKLEEQTPNPHFDR